MFLHIDFTSARTAFDDDIQESVGTKPPCSMIEAEPLPEVQSCCKVFDGLFRRSNMQQIMSLMKYSLDLSNPWISQYFNYHTKDKSTLDRGSMRALYKIWFAKNHDELLELFPTSGDLNFFKDFG